MAESEKTQLPTRSRCARRGIDRDVRRVASSTLAQVRHALVIQDFFDLKRIANPAPAMAAIETAM